MISSGVFHPHAGGAESLLRDLSGRLVREGHDVIVVSRRLDATPEEEELDGFRVVRFDYPIAYERFELNRAFLTESPRILRRLRREIRTNGVRTVCVGLVDMSALYFLILKPFLGFRLVTYLHGGEVRDVPAASPSFRKLIRAMLRASDTVVAVSSDLAEEARAFGRGIAEKTTVIPNGIDFENLDGAAPLRRPRPYVLYVGRMARDKNPADVVRGFAAAAERLHGVDLLMVGAGAESGALQRLATELGVAERVEFTGALDRTAVYGAMKSALLMLLASPAEGHPIAVVEALASGTPVIAARVRGTTDVVEDGVTGALFEPGDIDGLAALLTHYVLDASALATLRHNVARRDRAADDLGGRLPEHLHVLFGP